MKTTERKFRILKGFTQKQKDDWIRKLRSGRYEQSRGSLYKHDRGYCCLGVLGRCFNLDSIALLDHAMPTELTHKEFRSLGMKNRNLFSYLVEVNDSLEDQWSFGDIADFLETLKPAA